MTGRENRRRGDRFGHFRLHERLGQGEMTYVQRATAFDPDGRPIVVAIKRLLPHLAQDEQLVRKFVGEAKFVMRLDHPNIAKVFEYGNVDDDAFVSMECVDGDDLRKILRRATFMEKPPSLQVVLSILLKLCRALEYALSCTDAFGYGIKLIRRDISPADVVISSVGEPVIIDFGIARGYRTRQSTQKGTPTGDLGYLSPETLAGQYVDARSEIWSMGVLAHELVTAKPLFSSSDDDKTIGSVRDRPVPRPSTANENCPPQLDAIICRALERDPQQRWQSAGEMANALESLARDCDIAISTDAILAWCRELATAPKPIPSETQLGLGPSAQPHPSNLQPYSHVHYAGGPQHGLMTSDFGGASTEQGAAWDLSLLPTPPAVSAGDEPFSTESLKRSWPSGTVPLRNPTEGQNAPPRRGRYLWLTVAIAACALAVGYAIRPVATTATAPSAMATVEVITTPADAMVWIDGDPVATPLTLAPGTHQLRAERANYLPWIEELTAEAGSHVKLRIALAAEPDGAAPPQADLGPAVGPATPSVVAIGSTRVKRLRGSTLTLLPSQRRGRDRVRVLICLSPEGRVESSHVLSNLSSRGAELVQTQLARWQYRPVKVDGSGAVSACFTDSLSIR